MESLSYYLGLAKDLIRTPTLEKDPEFPQYFAQFRYTKRRELLRFYHFPEKLNSIKRFNTIESIFKYGLLGRLNFATLSKIPTSYLYNRNSPRSDYLIIAFDVPITFLEEQDKWDYSISNKADLVINIPEDIDVNWALKDAFHKGKLRRIPSRYINPEEMKRVNLNIHDEVWPESSEAKKFFELIQGFSIKPL